MNYKQQPPWSLLSTATTDRVVSHAASEASLNNEPQIPTTMQGSSGLTSRLQLQSLKAAAQTLGLANGSMGMSMVDGVFEKGQTGRKVAEGGGGDWGDLLRVLMCGQVRLKPDTG
jgi:hypothetical protein